MTARQKQGDTEKAKTSTAKTKTASTKTAKTRTAKTEAAKPKTVKAKTAAAKKAVAKKATPKKAKTSAKRHPVGKRALRKLAREVLGLEKLRPGQEEAALSVLSGRDTLLVMPTGAGKSAVYQLAGLVLAGPTMSLEGEMALFRWKKPLGAEGDAVVSEGAGLELVFDLPFTVGSDHAEGLALTSVLGEDALMIVYDSPDEARLFAGGVYADAYRI